MVMKIAASPPCLGFFRSMAGAEKHGQHGENAMAGTFSASSSALCTHLIGGEATSFFPAFFVFYFSGFC
jgi:hypothetical protein